jgi:hypothetical protein
MHLLYFLCRLNQSGICPMILIVYTLTVHTWHNKL